MPTTPIRVALADDHPLVRAGIRTTLAAEADVILVADVADGEEAQRVCVELQPDVLLLDLNMPGPRPHATVTYLQAHCPRLKVVVLTAYDDDAYVRGLLSAGVAGYVLKDEAPETVVQAIRTVMSGGTWFSRTVFNKFARSNPGSTEPGAIGTWASLNPREQQLLGMVVQGWDNGRIALELNLAEQTVRNYMTRLYQKMGFGSRAEAIIWAKDHEVDRNEGRR